MDKFDHYHYSKERSLHLPKVLESNNPLHQQDLKNNDWNQSGNEQIDQSM